MGKIATLFTGLLVISASAASAGDNKIDGWKTDRLEKGEPAVYHQALIFPRLAENNLIFKCEDGTVKIEVIGFKPLQKFPQPDMEIQIGDKAFSNIATAIYIKASKPSGPVRIPQAKLDDNLKGKDLSWPGYPAHSRLTISLRKSDEFFTAFTKGDTVNLSFAGQKLSFPELDGAAAEKFVELCKSKA
jgi:hypothetical protein